MKSDLVPGEGLELRFRDLVVETTERRVLVLSVGVTFSDLQNFKEKQEGERDGGHSDLDFSDVEIEDDERERDLKRHEEDYKCVG